ncbi:MAG: tRNA pseudouridine(55) synthase TruB [Bacteroidetes bacterium]|nr:tRNA pseudouridine(55) synthase TruB [Bacteroidota bacterium]
MSVFDFEAGEVLLLDKPLDWTSFDVVNKVRWALKRELKKKLKVGHAGTLDPRATGLLILCTGKKTKSIESIQAEEKEYTGTFYIGATTPTYDTESEPENEQSVEGITLEKLQELTAQFKGDILQKPPMHSAVKKDGKRLYELARKGQEVEVEPRKVTISTFEITEFSEQEAHFRVVCSKGTYIRSLANDFGVALGCGAYLKTLRRTRIGEHHVNDSMPIDKFVLMVAQLNSGN